MGIVTERHSTLGKRSIGWTSLLDAWGKTAFGELDIAAKKFDVVSNICTEAGWHSMAWQARVFKAVIECIKGDLRTAQKTLDTVKTLNTEKVIKSKKSFLLSFSVFFFLFLSFFSSFLLSIEQRAQLRTIGLVWWDSVSA